MTYADRLANLNTAYNNAPVAGSRELPPDGDYQCVVDRFDIFEGKTDGRLYLRTEMSVATGPNAGWPVSTLHPLEDPERLSYLKRHLDTLGVRPDTLADLERCLPDALDVPVLVAVKTKGEYRNVYVNQRLGDPVRSDIPVPSVPSGVPVSQGSDDVPF